MDAYERRGREMDEASQWWVRLGNRPPHEVSQEEREQFTHWLRESPLHISEFLHVAHVHDALGRFKLWKDVSVEPADEEENITSIGVPTFKRLQLGERRGKRKLFALAAAAAAIVLTTSLLLLQLRGQVIAADIAERREVMLNDGSVVKLEPDTTLRVRFDAHGRHVTLQQGRALFRVAKDPSRPFTVKANETFVRAVGTSFGVERKPRSIVVTVSEGKVAVGKEQESMRAQEGKSVDLSPTREEAAPIFLTAGQQVTVQNSGSAEPVRKVDTARALAWTEGRLVFDSAPLSEVVDEFNRYNLVQLRVDDRGLSLRPISGVFEASDPETLIAFIRAGAHAKVTRDSQQILIAPGQAN